MQRSFITLISIAAIALSACASGLTPLQQRQAQTHRDLADLKLQQGELGFAIRQYQAVLELDPKNAEAHFGLGEAYRRRGMLTDAERHFKRANRIDRLHDDALFNLGVVYIQQERWEDAIELNTQLSEEPTFLRPERALVNRGWALYKSGDLAGAKSDFQEVLAGNSADFHSHLNLGIVLYDQGETLQAMVHFERVLQLIDRRPTSAAGGLGAQARFHLAQAHVKLGQRDKAIRELERASQQGGSGEWATKSRAYLTVLQ
jgi:type IV pilus assembly protein PilF